MKRTLLIAATAIALSAPAVPHAHAAPHLNANQKKVGCSILAGEVFCPSPRTGMAWKKGHNPLLGEPAEAMQVPNPCDFGCTPATIAAWDRAHKPKPRRAPGRLHPSFDCVQAANNPEGPHCE